MNDHVNRLIEEYIDGELEKKREPELFRLISEDPAAMNYFRSLYVLKSAVHETIDEFSSELEDNILNSIKLKTTIPNKETFFKVRLIHYAFSLTAAVLLIISAFLFFELKDYKMQLAKINEQLIEQRNAMNVLLKQDLPPIIIKAENSLSNEIVVTPNPKRKI